MVLTRLQIVLAAAPALVSGRRIRQIDALFAPLKLPCAGVHGGERCDWLGRMRYLAPLLGAIPVEIMREANYRVDRDVGQEPPVAVARWLGAQVLRSR